MVGLGAPVRCARPSRQMDALQRAGCGVGGPVSVDPAHLIQAVMGQVLVLGDSRTRDL